MKFQLAINMERVTPGIGMRDVASHTLEMVQMADAGGFPKSCGRGLSAKGADGVARGSRCPAPPRHALLAENLGPKDWGKPSLWVIIIETWY